MSVCIASTVLGLALLAGSISCMTITDKQRQQLEDVFDDELDKKHEEIVRQRRNLYLQGLGIGMVLASVFLFVNVYKYRIQLATHKFYYISVFFAITLFTALIYYMLMPKDYMLNYLKTPEQNKAWLKNYKTYQQRYMWGLILGAVAAIPIANAFCSI